MPDPRRNHDALQDLREYLLEPRTIEEIRVKYGLSEPTVYRWLRYLREEGADIVSRSLDGKRVYQDNSNQMKLFT